MEIQKGRTVRSNNVPFLPSFGEYLVFSWSCFLRKQRTWSLWAISSDMNGLIRISKWSDVLRSSNEKCFVFTCGKWSSLNFFSCFWVNVLLLELLNVHNNLPSKKDPHRFINSRFYLAHNLILKQAKFTYFSLAPARHTHKNFSGRLKRALGKGFCFEHQVNALGMGTTPEKNNFFYQMKFNTKYFIKFILARVFSPLPSLSTPLLGFVVLFYRLKNISKIYSFYTWNTVRSSHFTFPRFLRFF